MTNIYAMTDEEVAAYIALIRAETNRLSAVASEARNALADARNTYARAAGMTEENTAREWQVVMNRHDRTKAGQALIAAVTAAQTALDAQVKIDTDMCNATFARWVDNNAKARAKVATTDPIVDACGTCGGDGNCPDCGVWDAPLTEVLANTPRDTDAYAIVEAAVLAAYPAAEVAPAPDPAPVADICERLDNDPISHAETSVLMRQAADEIRALRNALGVTQHTAAQLDIKVTMLRAEVASMRDAANVVIEAFKTDAAEARAQLAGVIADLRECETRHAATSSALDGQNEAYTAQVEQLTAELDKERNSHANTSKALQDLLNGEPITRVQKEDGEHWEVSVRYLRQSYYANGLTEADARARANVEIAYIRRNNKL